MYLLYGYMFTLETKLIIGNQLMALHYYGNPWEGRSFSNSFDRIDWKMIGLVYRILQVLQIFQASGL